MVGKKKKEHDFWFNPKEIVKNFKSIHWTPLRSKKGGTEGVLKKYGKVVLFMVLFAVVFVGIDALVSLVMKTAGFFG